MTLYDVTLVRKRGVCGGRPTLAGTRFEPHHLFGYFEHGDSTTRVMREYPGLSRAQVLFCKALWRTWKAHSWMRYGGWSPRPTKRRP